ncbi:HU family DNA-binding protein [Pseudogemmobacter sp. W21_MBD1_M6]|uniref:HU family DNA-binding protein n=1 Tax=Pseudogemmobacter sp. W21_MBD1_M6 TaxID=3240271 RepID=UPI003F96E801
MARATTTRSTSTPKKAASAGTGAAGAKSAATAKADMAATPQIDQADTAVVAGPALRKKEFVERVALACGVKKQTVKSVVDATLAELGLALENGEEPILQPFGKLKVTRRKSVPNGEMLVLRLRRTDPDAVQANTPDDGDEPLEVAAE